MTVYVKHNCVRIAVDFFRLPVHSAVNVNLKIIKVPIIKYNYMLRALPLRRVILGKLTSFYRPEIKIMIHG